jgi:3HB-oligomer hydrolase (3HBOH)
MPLIGTARSRAGCIAEGADDIIASGNLHRMPAIFVTGRNAGILPPNFTSRACFGFNNVVAKPEAVAPASNQRRRRGKPSSFPGT